MLVLGLFVSTCSPEAPARHPWIVIGIDGLEWKVIQSLWADERLPALRALADEGLSTALMTDYTASPVIWTTIATGVNPGRHGILDFVVATEKGDLPVASTLRKAPAIWELASMHDRRAAVLGWWATWPAEAISGPILSDRCLQEELENRVSPAELLGELERELPGILVAAERFGGNEASARRDAVMASWGQKLAGSDLDLLLVYFRSVDITSHNHWKGFEPEAFPELPEESKASSRGRVEAAYEAVDEAIGRIVEAAGNGTNVLVLSDHGFKAFRGERPQILLDIEPILERLAFLARGPEGVDFASTRLYPHASPTHRVRKLLRFSRLGREPGGVVENGMQGSIEKELEEAISRVRWSSGEPVLALRAPHPDERKQGGELVLEVLAAGAEAPLLLDGVEVPGALVSITRLSGTHTRRTHGVMIAKGPDLEPKAEAAGLRIHDIAPTLLYGLDLPVAADLDGRPAMHLFHRAFRGEHPLRSVATFGERDALGAIESAVDQQLIDELGALGYLD